MGQQGSEELRKEIEKRKEVEKKLQEQLSYEKAISECSNLLLKSTSPDVLKKSLKILQETTGSDRVYLYKNREDNGQLYLDHAMEVTATGVLPSTEYTNETFRYADVPWWHAKLSENKIINAQIDDIPEPKHSILQDQRVKSVLVIPINVNQEWYGYVGFAETKQKRKWHENEISLLRTAADIIAAFEQRKIIEESLVQQRNYTDTILDSLPSVYFLMNEDMEFVQWNSNAEKFTEYSGEELKEKNAFDLIVPRDHEKLIKATQRVRDSEADGTELTLCTKTGEEVAYFWRGYYIELRDKKYFLCVGLDITAQKQTERELMDEKRFNEALVESLPGIFYMIDSNGNYQRWNKNFVDQLGYSSDEIEDMTPADFYSDEEYEHTQAGIQEVFETGEAEIETTIITKDGDKVPYYLTGKLFIQNGEEYLVGVGHDISEQVEAREQLRKSEELFRNLFLKAPAAIVMTDPEHRIMNVNKSFEDLFGYSEDEIKGKDIDRVLVPETEQRTPTLRDKNGIENFHEEAKRLSKDDELIDVLVAGIPVYIDDKPLASFGMYIDISEQKKYEEEIYTSLKEKNVLLQEIHHRVKNNLAVISGLIQLQIYETDDAVIQETLKESESRIQTMALIHEKLYQSKDLSRIYCDSYIGDLVETIRSTIKTDKNISVHKEIEDVKLNINQAVPFALLINEVVTNSFKHAFKGKDEGQVKILLNEEDDQLKVQISDNGIGLPEGFNLEKSESLGMTLIHKFLQQLDAEWKLCEGNGFNIEITFTKEDVKGASASQLLDS